MKILKFGGTSVGTAASIKAILEIVAPELEQPEKPVIVLSAMSGVTNILLAMAEAAAEGEGFTDLLTQLEQRHFGVVKNLLDFQHQNPAFTALKMLFNQLEELLQGIFVLRELTPKNRDLVLSFGERCSGVMICRIFAAHFSEVLFVDARDVIKTDGSFGNAKVNTALTDLLIQTVYQENAGKLLLVTGFIAGSESGQTTTLGRGGSDYTAAIFGAALNAQEIQIWTDVNGMMTADPRMVKKAFPLNELTYTEAMELSYFGARVIYPPTMIPAFLKKIPIVIKNTFEPRFEGTVIRHNCKPSNLPIKGISSINNISILNLAGSGMVGKAGFSGRLFSLLAREQINIILITQSSSEHSITFAVQPQEAEQAKKLIEQEFELELLACKLDAVVVVQKLAILAVVGENMKQMPGISGKLFQALGRNGVNVQAIAQGSSEYNISVIIAAPDLPKALNAVHDAFFVQLTKTLHVFCLGTGNIGTTLLQQLSAHSAYLEEHNGVQVKISGISNTRKMAFSNNTISLTSWKEELDASAEAADLDVFVRRMQQMNLPNCVFIDNTASAAPVRFYEAIFKSSISIITCNKIGNSASYGQYRTFKDTARRYGVDFCYETNVGAGLPIINTLKNLMNSGDQVLRIEAILSGTISFIFNHFKGDASFHDIVKEAQDRGYTEPDPRDDLSGKDFMRKMLILARDAGHALEEADVVIESVLPKASLEAATVGDFYSSLHAEAARFNQMKDAAADAGKVLRYIGKLEEGKVSISLQMVDDSHPFYTLSGSDNIISFTTARYKERPLVVKGPGAGSEVTAAGVFAEMINLGAG